MIDPSNNPIAYDDDDEDDDILDDETLAVLGAMYARLEMAPSIMNPRRRKQFSIAYRLLRRLLGGSDATVVCKMDYPWKNNGTIIVEGTSLLFRPSLWFSCAAELADSVDIYPLLDDRMRMEFLFVGMNLPFDPGRKV
jgi:hypothetical protein